MNIINNTDKLSEEIITNLTDLCINNINKRNLERIQPIEIFQFLRNLIKQINYQLRKDIIVDMK